MKMANQMAKALCNSQMEENMKASLRTPIAMAKEL